MVQQIQMDYTSAVEMQMKLMIIFISCYYFYNPSAPVLHTILLTSYLRTPIILLVS